MADRSEIDEVRTRTDIVALIEQYVTLKRSGKNLKGLCPFHNEKTPSFYVDPDLGRWKCFGQCSEGGDVFKFVQKIENLSFVEALERLALRAGVTLSAQRGREDNTSISRSAPEISERDRLYRINALALGYYRDMLSRTPFAQEYLQERKLAYAIQDAFSLGYAPDAWDGLTTYLSAQNISLTDAETAGLISRSERGGYFDKLRGRLLFPIFDVQERPIAFGGRLIGEAKPGQPKYWNSPETPVFSKSRTLYGLWRARKAIAAQGQAIVVEGYTDVVAAHQAGFENVVATLGTSLTEEHVKVLARLAPTVLLAFDADSAGMKAAFRAAEIFEAQEVEVRVLDLPEGEDPDSLLRANRRRVFEQAIETALPLTEYRIMRLIRKMPVETERERVALFRKALPILAAVPSIIEREQYIKLLTPYHPHYSAGGAFAEEHIRQDVTAYQGMRGYNAVQMPGSGQSAMPLPPKPRGATELAERNLLRALVSGDSSLMEYVLAGMTPEDFQTPGARRVAGNLDAHHQKTGSLDAPGLMASWDDEESSEFLTGLLMTEEEPLSLRALSEEIRHLRARAKSEKLTQIKAQIDSGTYDAEMLNQFLRLKKELKGSPETLGSSAGERDRAD